MTANGTNGKNGKADSKVVTAYRTAEAAFVALDNGEGSVEYAQKCFDEFSALVNSVKLTPKSQENADKIMNGFGNRLKAYQDAEKIKGSVAEAGNSLRKYLDSTEVNKGYAVEMLGAYQEAVDAYKVTDLPEGVKKRRNDDIKEFHNDIIDLEDRILKLPDAKPQPKIEALVEVPMPVEVKQEQKPMSVYDKYPNDPDWKDIKEIEEWLERNPIKNKSA